MVFGHDFFQIRTIWFGINVVAFCVTAIAYANWLGGPRFSAYWLSMPLVLLATTTLTSLEIGNAHFLIITISLLGVLLLERRRYAIGGALLGYCVVGKIFPGVLLAYLVFARRWSAVVATGIAMIGYVLATFAIFGVKPFTAFVEHQMPMLASGEAFSFAFEMIGPLTANLSVMGIPYRLDNRLPWSHLHSATSASGPLNHYHRPRIQIAASSVKSDSCTIFPSFTGSRSKRRVFTCRRVNIHSEVRVCRLECALAFLVGTEGIVDDHEAKEKRRRNHHRFAFPGFQTGSVHLDC